MKALLNAFLESISNLKVHFLPFSRCITKELPPDGDSIGEDKLFFPAQNVVIGGNFYMTVFFMHSESDRETIINLFICLFLVFALTLTDGGRHSKLFCNGNCWYTLFCLMHLSKTISRWKFPLELKMKHIFCYMCYSSFGERRISAKPWTQHSTAHC